jgi:tetratricopeptide (TPR) repeat protein
MHRRRLIFAILCAVLPAAALAAVAPAPATGATTLGDIRFPNSGAVAAQPDFIRGVLLLHSFEFEDAAEAFRATQRIDPGFALAYWGEAMTCNHPLWREQDRDAARAVLSRLAPTSEARRAKAPTERERGYLAAVDLLYGDGDKPARDTAYSEAMGELSARYPNDLEAKAFYALSVLGTAEGDRDFAVYMRAAAIAEEVFAASPRHPGAAHYLIHAYDDPIHAPLGLRAARVYAEIAPAASHAQHMISHIYVALGQWDQAVEANVKAVDVAAARRALKGLGVDAQNYHALHWLEYSYLQLGRFDAARVRLDAMTAAAKESGSPRALWHHAAMRAAWIVETGGRPAPPEIRPDATQVAGAAADLFATGYAAYLAGNLDAAGAAATRIGERRDTAVAAGHLCSQGAAFMNTSKVDLVVTEVMQKCLRALVAQGRGDTATALALLGEATAAEDAMVLDYGPPAIVKPSHEVFGEVLLKIGRPADARVEFAKALARAPRRSLSLAGLARAAKATGESATLLATCATIAGIYASADAAVAPPSPCAIETAGPRVPR